MLIESDGWTFTWQAGRQLATMTKEGMDLSFKYNDGEIRTEKTVSGKKTKYHLVGDKQSSWIQMEFLLQLNLRNRYPGT